MEKHNDVYRAIAVKPAVDCIDEPSEASTDGFDEPIEISVFVEFPPAGQASETGQDLQGITDADLVDLVYCPGKEAEIERRLAQTSEPNQLFYQFLITDQEDHDGIQRIREKLVHLIAKLFREQHIRRIPRQPGDPNPAHALRERIETAIYLSLLPIKNCQTATEITLLALQGGFGDIATDILAELKAEANEHRQAVRTGRKASIKYSPSLDFVMGVDKQGKNRTFGDTVGLNRQIPRCPLGSISTFDKVVEFVSSNRDQIVEAIGDRAYRTLLEFIDFAGQEETAELEETEEPGHRQFERGLTECLQKRGVSPQQARKDKRNFRKAMDRALKAKNPVILALIDLLKESRKTIFEDLVS